MTVVDLTAVRQERKALADGVAGIIELIGNAAEAQADVAFCVSSTIVDHDIARAVNRYCLRRLKRQVKRELRSSTWDSVRDELVEYAINVFTARLILNADGSRRRA